MWKKKEPKQKKWMNPELKSLMDLSNEERYAMAVEMIAEYPAVPSEQKLLLFQ